MRKPRLILLGLIVGLMGLALLSFLLLSQAPEEPMATEQPRYVATIPPLVFMLEELVEGRAEVVGLLGPEDSPHTYEPRPSDARLAENATALFYVAPTLDEWATRLPGQPKIEVLSMVPESMRQSFASTNTIDPHFWMDPLTVKATLPALTQSLSRLDPGGAAVYAANANKFASELDALDAQIRGMLRPVKGKAVVLFHPCCVYFLKRYDLPLLATIEPSPGQEPTPRQVQVLIQQMKQVQTDVVFTEPQLPPQAANLIAESLNARIYQLDALGGVKGRNTYAELLLYNAHTLKEALQ